MQDPLLEIHDSDNAKQVLRPILVAVALGLGIILVPLWMVATRVQLAAPVALIATTAATAYLLNRGRIRSASLLFIAALVIVGTVTIATYGSLRTSSSLTYVGAVVVAGIFGGRRTLMAVALLTSALSAVLVWAERAGLIGPPTLPVGLVTWFIFSVSSSLIGMVVYYSRSLTLDALRRQEHEAAVRQQAEERLRLSLEVSRQGWFDLDVQTGAVTTSSQFPELLGGDRAQPHLSLQAWMESIHRDDRDAVLATYQDCLASGETRQMEYRLRALNGEWRWIRSIARVVDRDAKGQPHRMMGTHADISEQRRASEALRESEERYRALVDRLPLGILVHRDGRLLFANPAAHALLGASPGSLVGRPVLDFLEASEHLRAQRMIEEAERTGRDQPATEHRLLRVDGSAFDASVLRVPITFEGQRAIQVTLENITERKVLDATRLRSQKLESLGTLAGGIAHDFNNILSAIRGNADLAADDLEAEHPASESLAAIQQAGVRATELIRRIVAFGRPEEPKRSLTDLGVVVQEALRLLRPVVPAGVALRVNIGHGVPLVLADAAQVHEAVLNLTANAAYAIGGRPGSVDYFIDAVVLDADEARLLSLAAGEYARLRVADTGHGMDTATMQRIFDAFFTTKPVGEGTGLGLSMVYGTMQSHGGTVAVESAPGNGARFDLYFPVARAPDDHARVSATPAALTAAHQTVLLVDDEPTLVSLAERGLTRQGHRVFGFTHPATALEAFRLDPDQFDVVITDLSMPHMSGLELARHIRRIRADVPVILTTGFLSPETEADARAAGIDEVTVKASTVADLSSAIARVITRPRRERGATPPSRTAPRGEHGAP